MSHNAARVIFALPSRRHEFPLNRDDMACNSYYFLPFFFFFFFLITFKNSYGLSIALESESEVAQSCPTLCDPMDCSLSGSSVYGIFQARVLEWIAISFSRRSSQPRNSPQSTAIIWIEKSQDIEDVISLITIL